MRVNQVVRADRPSKLRKWRCPKRSAFWTASSASSLFRRMAWAIATNFGRKVTNISWTAPIPTTPVRVSARLWDSCLPGLQDLDCAILFVLLGTRRGLLIAASVLVCPVKLADVDAKVIGGSPFPSLLHEASGCPTGASSVNHSICPVFNEEKTRKLLAARGGTPITQRFWRRLDGNV